ncbi:uncharacterized protein LOC122532564 isoform X2 [Frieseomelitta varia]|uniref:uncharacterized protein LOC122532564 isoform X2 n=1 Tax=Frieseomelitta varia TaxID=561572 RepID=UPI001CB6AD98|nr:uncharacterized protein LOC122532564 isoform X2 [Frieseomelitta varia]
MAIPFVMPSDDEAGDQGQRLEQLMLDLYAALQQVLRSRAAQHASRNHRLPRRAGDNRQPVILVDSDLSRMPLPDLVLYAVEQLPPASPQVTVSAPSSPTRDVAFQFPECSSTGSDQAPVPSPRPRPRRRRLASEGCGASAMKKGPVVEPICNSCCGHFGHGFSGRQWVNPAEIGKTRLPANPVFEDTNNANESSDGILSFFPAALRETLWTTMALYLGWRLVSRLR